jgi:hypothetical protein
MWPKAGTRNPYPSPVQRRWWNDYTKALLFRSWAAGAVCFFSAWGRQPASAMAGSDGLVHVGAAYSLDLILGLVVLMVLSDWIIVSPVIKMAFNISENRSSGGVFVRLYGHILHLARITGIVLVIVTTYFALNRGIIALAKLDPASVPVPLEPILFGILYGAYYALSAAVAKALRKLFFAKKTASYKEKIYEK